MYKLLVSISVKILGTGDVSWPQDQTPSILRSKEKSQLQEAFPKLILKIQSTSSSVRTSYKNLQANRINKCGSRQSQTTKR